MKKTMVLHPPLTRATTRRRRVTKSKYLCVSPKIPTPSPRLPSTPAALAAMEVVRKSRPAGSDNSDSGILWKALPATSPMIPRSQDSDPLDFPSNPKPQPSRRPNRTNSDQPQPNNDSNQPPPNPLHKLTTPLLQPDEICAIWRTTVQKQCPSSVISYGASSLNTEHHQNKGRAVRLPKLKSQRTYRPCVKLVEQISTSTSSTCWLTCLRRSRTYSCSNIQVAMDQVLYQSRRSGPGTGSRRGRHGRKMGQRRDGRNPREGLQSLFVWRSSWQHEKGLNPSGKLSFKRRGKRLTPSSRHRQTNLTKRSPTRLPSLSSLRPLSNLPRSSRPRLRLNHRATCLPARRLLFPTAVAHPHPQPFPLCRLPELEDSRDSG